MTFRLLDLRLILLAVGALALLAVFALAPDSVSPSGVAHAQSADPDPTIVNICDRTEKVRDEIRGSVPCDEVTDAQLSAIVELRLVSRGITGLTAGDFAGLHGLRRLNLGYNYLTALPGGVFDGLTELQELDLDGNYLRTLPDGVFDDLTNLQELDLGANSLTTVPDDAFDSLSKLKELRLGSNFISELPDDVFANLPNLEWVFVGNNRLSEVPASWFANRSNLKWLSLSKNELTDLPDDAFAGLSNLMWLHLLGNDLNRVSASWFEDLSNLRTLSLTADDLSDPPDNVFASLSNLSNLRLHSTTQGSEVSAEWFEHLSHLWDLMITAKLTALPDGVFANLTGLNELDLGFNGFTELSADWFEGLSNVKRLDLGSNQLTHLSGDWFEHLPNLERLHLGWNDLTELPADWFEHLPNLERLRLDWNDLAELPPEVFDGLSNLRDLDLHHNDLTELPPEVFDGLSNLTNLNLGHNDLTELPPGVFDGLSNLRIVYLYGNDLTELPDGLFNGLSNLRRVGLYMNPGAPFTFKANLAAAGENAFVATVAQGAPYDMEVALSAEGGTLSSDTITIEGGSITSDAITVTTDGGGGGRVKITVESAEFKNYIPWHGNGHNTAAGQPLVLDVPAVTDPGNGICDRTQQVQDAIIAKLNEGLDTPEVTGCAEVTAEDLRGITGAMELSIEEIPALKSGDFEGLSNLNSLLMIDSGLETLPEDIFDGLTALHSLFIIGNDDLETLPEDIFDGLTGLTNLHVSGNEALGELPEGIFDGLTSLAFLHLAENSLTTLPEEIFDGLTSLQLLHLQNNQLTGLPSGIFDGLGNLKYILLNGNSLRALPADVFEGLSSLTQLPLEGNNLESLPDGLFEGLVSLEQVLLSGNPGVPFALTAELEQRGHGAFVVKVVEGSPFDLTVTLSALGGTLSSTTAKVAAGSLASGPVSVSVDGSGPAQVTVTVESATFPEDREHSGIDTGLGQPLVLEIPGNPPAETVQLTVPASVPRNAEATVTMSFANLESDSDTSDTDYIFRADVKDAENGDADACEGGGMGNDRYMYKVDEDPEVRAATISAACPPGDYTIEVSISSPGNVELASATADFTVNAPAQQQQDQEPPPSTDATLNGLTLSSVPFTFASDTTSYDVNVANRVDETTVTPTTNDGGASYVVKLGGVTDDDSVIPLAVGSNVITIEVTAEDGNTAKTYTVTVTRAEQPASGPAVAIGLSPSGSVAEGTEVTVTMSFANLESDSDTSDTDYIFRADVVNADACEGGGMGNDRYMYQVDDDPEVRSGTISASCAPGDYTVAVSISSPGNAELASATADFTVAAPAQQQRQAQEPPPSTDATLSGLTLSDVTLSFASSTTGYTASVANDVAETTVTPTTNDDGATYEIKLGGVADADGVIPLAVGSNVITIEVTAEDGNTVKTYTVTVTRAAPPSTDATLSGLVLTGVDIGAFDSATTGYTVSVANDVTQTTVTPTTNDDGATYEIKLDGVADADRVIPLAVGSNVITVEVTAEDGQTTKTYTVTVTRAAPAQQQPEPPSTDATLSGLTLSDVTLAFASSTTGYTASVANDVTQTTVTPTTNDDGATYEIKLGGVAYSDGTVSLAVGSNVITVEVIAEDGQTTKTYKVTITRAAPPSTDATLSGLALTGVDIGAFDSATTEYTASVANGVDETTVTPTTNDDGATYVVKLGGVTDDDSVSPLAVGKNVITVEVTAEDGQTAKTYTVTVTRAAAEPTPDSPPKTPDAPTGKVTGIGQVELDWKDVEGATHYQVRFFDDAAADWVELPTDEIGLVLDGSGAAVSNLPDYGTYYFSVRAGNAAGLSEWSEYLTLPNPEQ